MVYSTTSIMMKLKRYAKAWSCCRRELKDKLPEKAVYAIKAHDYRTGFKPESMLDKALIAADSAAILMEKSWKPKRS